MLSDKMWGMKGKFTYWYMLKKQGTIKMLLKITFKQLKNKIKTTLSSIQYQKWKQKTDLPQTVIFGF